MNELVLPDLRLKFMTLLMLIVLSISITITVLRFGRAALQDNFVAELSTHYENSTEFVAFYGLLNIYMYTMAYVYSPPPSNNNVFGKLTHKHSVIPLSSLRANYFSTIAHLGYSNEFFYSQTEI